MLQTLKLNSANQITKFWQDQPLNSVFLYSRRPNFKTKNVKTGKQYYFTPQHDKIQCSSTFIKLHYVTMLIFLMEYCFVLWSHCIQLNFSQFILFNNNYNKTLCFSILIIKQNCLFVIFFPFLKKRRFFVSGLESYTISRQVKNVTKILPKYCINKCYFI